MDELISENPRAAFLGSSDLVLDWIPAQLGENHFKFLGASKQSYIHTILKDFHSLDLHPIRMEPGPGAALRAACHCFPSPSRTEPEIRILFGQDKAWAILSQGQFPLGWQRITLEQGLVEDKIFSAVKSLVVYARWRLKGMEVERVLLQGDKIPEELAAKLSGMLHLSVQCASSPVCDGNFIAFGLALGALKPDTQAINLARSLQKSLPLSVIFPRLQAGIALCVVSLVLLSMWLHVSDLGHKVKKLKRENAQASWAIGKKAYLIKLHNKGLLDEAGPLSDYLTDRVLWAPILEGLPGLLPSNARLVEFRGEDNIWSKQTSDREVGERFISIRLAAKFSPEGRMPQAIDGFVDTIRNSAVFIKNFPRVQLQGINWRKDIGSEMAYAQISCLPKQIKRSSWEIKMIEEDAEKSKTGGKDSGKTKKETTREE